MANAAKYITALASASFIFASVIDAQLGGFAARWTEGRDAIEVRIVDNYTDDKTGEYAEHAAGANRREIQKFVNMILN